MTDRIHQTRNPGNSPLTVGVLMDSVGSFFNRRLITDLIDSAAEYNIHLRFFFGGSLDSDTGAGNYAYAYSLPSAETVDALIVLPHSISPCNPISSLQIITAQFKALPVYGLCGYLPGYYSAWTDDNGSISEMIDHLVNEHAYRRFRVVTGPIAAESASTYRLNIIQRELQKSGISLSPGEIVTGGFTKEDGVAAAQRIIATDGERPEVLLCLNDQMAIGAIKEFTNNGFSVPRDIAVVGFDDVEENTINGCTLTTINIPVWHLVSTIMQRIVSDHTGVTCYEPAENPIQSEFMQRESCGCATLPISSGIRTPANLAQAQPKISPSQLKKQASLRHSLETIIESCLDAKDTTPFGEFIQTTVGGQIRSGDLTDSFFDTFSAQWTVTLLKHADFHEQVLINGMFIDAFRLLFRFRTDFLAQARANDQGSLAFYQSCNKLLSQKLEMTEALRGIAANLPQMGIRQCDLILLAPNDPSIGELRLRFRENTFTVIPKTDFTRFPAQRLYATPPDVIPDHEAILTLAQNNVTMGYMIVSIHEKNFAPFDMVQQLVSQIVYSAMNNDLLSSHIKSLTQKNDLLSRLSVIDEATGLYNRRALYVTGRALYQKAQANNEPTCFAFFDMDGLKKINDGFGHREGDLAILSLANILKSSFRDKDLLVRYGGDEFVVLMADTDQAGLDRALGRIEAQLREFNETKAHPWTLSACWGSVVCDGSSPYRSLEAVIEESDARLYRQKHQKKQQVEEL